VGQNHRPPRDGRGPVDDRLWLPDYGDGRLAESRTGKGLYDPASVPSGTYTLSFGRQVDGPAPVLPATSTVGQTLTVNPGVWTETPDYT